MPRVTLHFNSGQPQTRSCGCFGFTGRHGMDSSDYDLNNSQLITNYEYHLGEAISSSDYHTFTGNFNPKPFIDWVINDSMWSKYITGHTMGSGVQAERNGKVSMGTDVEGHAIVGTASALRLAYHGLAQSSPFIHLWNRMVNAGANPAIAFLVAYTGVNMTCFDILVRPNRPSTSESDSKLITAPVFRPPALGSAGLGLGDDKDIRTEHFTDVMAYAFINKTLEYKTTDHSSRALYRDRTGYAQEILNSFDDSSQHGATPASKPLSRLIFDRLYRPIRRVGVRLPASGMSRSSVSTPDVEYVMTTSLVGVALQYTSEYNSFGKILSWGV